jgi:hypothetical protein
MDSTIELRKFKEGQPSANYTLPVQIGNVCCALKCGDNEVYNKLKRLYRNFLTEQAADFTIELDVTYQPCPDNMSGPVSEALNIPESNRSWTGGQQVSCQYEPARSSLSITGDRSLVDPDIEGNNLNLMLSLAYYSACKLKYDGNPPAMLVHSCGIIRHGQALVFSGPSGAGKTTIARLCGKQDGEVINDETLLISWPTRTGDGIIVQSAPIMSRLSPRENKSAPLRCILLLKHSNRTTVRCLDRTKAYLRFISQIITPVYASQMNTKAILSQVSEFCDQVTSQVPVYELEFNLDGESLWQKVGELEKELAGRETR